MSRTIQTLVLMTLLLLFPSCMKEQLEVEYTRQEEQIDRYIKSLLDKDPTFSVTHNKGSNRVTLLEGSGKEIGPKSKASIRYAAYIFTGSISPGNLIATNDAKLAEEAGWNLTDFNSELSKIDLSDKNLIPGLAKGLIGAKEGEECQIIFSGKYGFGNKHNNIIDKNQALLYHILVVSVE